MDAATDSGKSLIENNVQYAKNLSRKFFAERSEMGIEFEEFCSAAYLGLCDAAQRFDRSKGENFQTYSFLRIRGAMYDLLRRGGWSTYGAFPWFERPEEGSERERPEPTSNRRRSYVPGNISELAGALDLVEELNFKLWVDQEGEQVELTYSDHADPEHAAVRKSLADFLRRVVEALPPRERQIIELYYFDGWTFEDMREHFAGVSRSWLSRMHSRALERLRAQIELACRKCERRVQACSK